MWCFYHKYNVTVLNCQDTSLTKNIEYGKKQISILKKEKLNNPISYFRKYSGGMCYEKSGEYIKNFKYSSPAEYTTGELYDVKRTFMFMYYLSNTDRNNDTYKEIIERKDEIEKYYLLLIKEDIKREIQHKKYLYNKKYFENE